MQTILNSPWNREFQRSQREAIQARTEQRFSSKTCCHGTATASPNSPQRPEAAGQGSSAWRTPDPSLGCLGLYTAARPRGAGLQRPGSWRQPRAGAQQGTRVMEERARGRYGCSLSTREREGPASPSLVWWNVPEPGNSGYHFRPRLKSLHKEPIFVPQRQR